ncbi:hypothetical protein [uncultured Algibacter sp.]|uniref:hypothetical protein n=1 Tax=uncultured Algibacter sp. TaxID=298659 RepID=UPI002630616D|nr:hypothetical protein [uncultured Algibacter sp.]
MKSILLFFILIFCLISCDNKEKYNGKWSLDIFQSNNNEQETPSHFHIENNSIKFNYWSFNHSHKFSLKIENNQFLFNNWAIKTNIIKDTLLLHNSFYVRDNNDSIYNWLYDKPITEIEVPKLNSDYFKFDNLNYKDSRYYILFGKRTDNNKFSLQLNDKYAEINDLPAFINNERASERHELIPFYSTYLFADKSTPMKYIEDIFFEHKKINQLKICLINNILLKYNDSLGLYYKYEKLTKRLPPFRENDNYHSNTSANKYQTPPPPPLLYYSDLNNEKPNIKLILLKNNTIYFNDTIVETNHLKNLIKPWIEDNNTLLNLYDLESNYFSFLEMNAIINSVYQEVREEKSKIKFNKILSELNREELTEIKIETPIIHIWDYSIPHFNRIVEKGNSFYGLEVTHIE